VNDAALSIQYQDGALHFTVNELDSIRVVDPERPTLRRLHARCGCNADRWPDDNGYGVIARYVDDHNFYRFDISGDGYFDIMKFKAGKWIKLQDWKEAATIHQGTADQSPALNGQRQPIHFGHQRSSGGDHHRQ